MVHRADNGICMHMYVLCVHVHMYIHMCIHTYVVTQYTLVDALLASPCCDNGGLPMPTESRTPNVSHLHSRCNADGRKLQFVAGHVRKDRKVSTFQFYQIPSTRGPCSMGRGRDSLVRAAQCSRYRSAARAQWSVLGTSSLEPSRTTVKT